jgi:hypothetical protein
MSARPSYVRIKRHNLTIFLHCDLHNDTVLHLKERIEKLIDKPVLQQRLLLGKQALELNTTLHDCGIEKDDAELLLAFSTGEDTWEDPRTAAEGGQAADAEVAAAPA